MNEKTGCFGTIEGNRAEDESIVPVAVLFYFPPDLTAEEALKLIEIHQSGELSPSLAIGLLAIASFFSQGGKFIHGMHIGYIQLGGTQPTHGISYLSDKSIENRAVKYITDLVENGAALEPYLPESAVDRARFMLKLAECCWQPDLRRKIARAYNHFEQIFPLFLLAIPYLYLNPGATTSVAGIEVPVKLDYENHKYRWQQYLEWDAHLISTDTLEFLLPRSGNTTGNFTFEKNLDLPVRLIEVATELTKIVLKDVSLEQPFSTRYLRVRLPDCFFFKRVNMTGIRLHSDTEHGFWVGIDTPTDPSISFWWQPQSEMPMAGLPAVLMCKSDRSCISRYPVCGMISPKGSIQISRSVKKSKA